MKIPSCAGIGAFAFALSASAAATIDVTKVQQRWPWNNKVDVTYTIAADNADKRVNKVTITTTVDGQTYTVYDGAPNENATPGTHTVTWENAPAGAKSSALTMNAAIYSAIVPEGDDYMIIDLKDGSIKYEGLFADNAIAGCSGQELSNARYNCDKYKSTHYPLRKIPKGTYKTGDSANFGSGGDLNTDAVWTTDKVFYIGVFKWTNYQYWHILDKVSSVEQMTRKDRSLKFNASIRGVTDPTIAPARLKTDSYNVLEWLNAKTYESGSSLVFDLPTELMHEIATRAGTETPYFWGTDASLASEYAVCGRSGTRPALGWAEVGTKKPNAWGLYDMVGLQWEWCLDCYLSGSNPANRSDVFTPFVSSDTRRRVRSSTGADAAVNMRSSRRSAGKGGATDGDQFSFRISCIIPNAEEPAPGEGEE